jgi:hypothetical protein
VAAMLVMDGDKRAPLYMVTTRRRAVHLHSSSLSPKSTSCPAAATGREGGVGSRPEWVAIAQTLVFFSACEADLEMWEEGRQELQPSVVPGCAYPRSWTPTSIRVPTDAASWPATPAPRDTSHHAVTTSLSATAPPQWT